MADAGIICPLCGGISYRSLEEHYRDRHPIIKSLKHEFQLISQNLTDQYLLIKIKNLTLKFMFVVYRSNSHGGIFRVCSVDAPSHLYKGDTDYVTQTFIHMDLQKFIVENLGNLLKDTKLTLESCPLTMKTVSEITYHNLINGNAVVKRRYRHHLFDLIDNIQCGYGFLDEDDNMIKIIENILQLDELDILRGGKKRFTEILIATINDYIKEPSKRINTSSIDLSNLISIIVTAYNSIKTNIYLRMAVAKLYLEVVSDYLDSNFYIMPGTNKELYTDIYTVPKIKDVRIKMTYYSVDIETKPTPDKRIERNMFRVIYARYKIDSPHPEFVKDHIYSIVFNIIPLYVIEEGKILPNGANRLGIYHKYISAGIYLCKIFDYSHQVTALAGAKEHGHYIFLGNIYDNLYPVNKIWG